MNKKSFLQTIFDNDQQREAFKHICFQVLTDCDTFQLQDLSN